jgi:hypothetical protein
MITNPSSNVNDPREKGMDDIDALIAGGGKNIDWTVMASQAAKDLRKNKAHIENRKDEEPNY